MSSLRILVRQSPASFLDLDVDVATRPPEKSKTNMQRKSSLPANAKVATFLSSVSAFSDKVECEGRQMKQC